MISHVLILQSDTGKSKWKCFNNCLNHLLACTVKFVVHCPLVETEAVLSRGCSSTCSSPVCYFTYSYSSELNWTGPALLLVQSKCGGDCVATFRVNVVPASGPHWLEPSDECLILSATKCWKFLLNIDEHHHQSIWSKTVNDLWSLLNILKPALSLWRR